MLYKKKFYKKSRLKKYYKNSVIKKITDPLNSHEVPYCLFSKLSREYWKL